MSAPSFLPLNQPAGAQHYGVQYLLDTTSGQFRPLYTTDFSPSASAFTPFFSLITGSQLVIPSGSRSASITIISGSAYVNGTGALPAGLTLNLGNLNNSTLSSPVVVGATGSASSPSQVFVMWEV